MQGQRRRMTQIHSAPSVPRCPFSRRESSRPISRRYPNFTLICVLGTAPVCLLPPSLSHLKDCTWHLMLSGYHRLNEQSLGGAGEKQGSHRERGHKVEERKKMKVKLYQFC